ncbi:MAG: GtrA family protein [Clostridia bacterium]|nr:GtrA family protein [Clostridia bacterium]
MNNQKQTKRELFFEVCRFLLVGGIATLLDYAAYYLFRQCLLSPEHFSSGIWNAFSLFFSTAIGFSAGLIFNWIFSVRFVFRGVKDREKAASKTSFLRFCVIALLGLLLTEVGMHVGVWLLPEFSLFGVEEWLGVSVKEWTVKACMTLIVLVFNYVARKRFVFKS